MSEHAIAREFRTILADWPPGTPSADRMRRAADALDEMLAALKDMTRIARAATYATGVTGNTARVERAATVIAKAEGRS